MARPVPAFWQPTAMDTAKTRYWLARGGGPDDPKAHGTGPMCDYGFTGKDCTIPVCGSYHYPPLKPGTKCVELEELSPLSTQMRTAQMLYDLGFWRGPSYADGVLVPRTPISGFALFLVLLLAIRTVQYHLRTLFTLAVLFMAYVMSSE